MSALQTKRMSGITIIKLLLIPILFYIVNGIKKKKIGI